ncbi:3-deoxy-D-arabinoheptulosonate-7-phosphate synthase [Anaerobranca californiensis DSM 14826]|uniref:3-deoxy-D-arabinoheptulosonate-7-phosphate synthase n=1 Tax=Anaerobranca californiensis DSM 14826 TaxID=1120989 RepID=A0A1M6N6J4_9FIRM|nr:3-deoxy-7-phosphoheptulonate synthase [Anaerobranca californiensis]SHJ91348.1 3-deoxy-D-arabinoheptulosonate-7-phosphate synthase [Anaerobranca californiensis DSM 14826]
MLIIHNFKKFKQEYNEIISIIKEKGEGYTEEVKGDFVYITCTNGHKLREIPWERFQGIHKAVPLEKPYHLVSRDYQEEDTVIDINGVKIGKEKVIIAGPCAIESEEQLERIACFLKEQGVKILRGGAYKPRTSPYSFQGLKEEGLILLQRIGKKYNMITITEAVSLHTLDKVAQYSDIIQIGARNMANYELLKAVGKYQKPVLLKRGMASTIEEFLTAAEYIVSEGNKKVILCERGIRTFETYTRNTLDLSAVASIKKLSHLPIIVDPSHGTGKWFLVTPMAKGALACGADGIMVEVHHDPLKALSDGEQSLNFTNFKNLKEEIAIFM